MALRPAALVFVVLGVVVARSSRADEREPRVVGRCTPVRVPLGPADLGVLPEACEATEAAVVTHAAVLVATRDLYGSLQAGAGVRGRLIVAERTWLSLWSPSLEYRYVANASVDAERVSVGGTALGVHHRLPISERLSLSPFARVLLPTETGFERASRWGGEQGISAGYHARRDVDFVFGYAFTLVTVVNGGRFLSVLGESVSGDVIVRPWTALAFAGGVATRFALASSSPFESFDPKLGARLYPWRGVFVVLDAALPLWGRDRTDLALALSAGLQR